MSPKRWLSFIGLFLAVVLMMWAWRDVSWTHLGQTLQQIHLGWIVLATLTFLAAFVIRAHRWGLLLPGIEVSFGIRVAAVFIGFAGNCVLPANAGELVRVGVLKRRAAVPVAIALGSIVSARLLDAAIALLFLVGPLLWLPQLQVNNLAIVALGLGVVIIYASFWLAANAPKRIETWVEWILIHLGLQKRVTTIQPMVRNLLQGFAVLKSPKALGLALLDTLAVWLLSGISFWVVLKAFDLTTPGFIGALFIQSMEALAVVIPSTPGHLGAFEAAVRFALGLYGIQGDSAIGYTLVMRLIMYGSLSVVGGLFALGLGLSNGHNPINDTPETRLSKTDSLMPPDV
ncbi:lysylphosphatidylglycerol synthase transmembrane domain-containing protein [Leptothoe spongobia]|uniref:Flippase-like domain-containing protein n=1 Tax=Leptothoe spongobia TAU-MAC 1115 TaxID=1967444 RepID=A0A947GJY2_9CYAN|nr:lysylphosphatidylglycerol synthase transmembrane domain-containing protein [Leptothoe spongobia]MBT9317395.1 flippase-like domain-containing protein [Leptothoe spongobia TAU-MAC 1115]